MVKIIADTALLVQLKNLEAPLEFCDASGRILGYYQPATTAMPRSPFSIEELERRRQQRTGKPLSEILKRLERT